MKWSGEFLLNMLFGCVCYWIVRMSAQTSQFSFGMFDVRSIMVCFLSIYRVCLCFFLLRIRWESRAYVLKNLWSHVCPFHSHSFSRFSPHSDATPRRPSARILSAVSQIGHVPHAIPFHLLHSHCHQMKYGLLFIVTCIIKWARPIIIIFSLFSLLERKIIFETYWVLQNMISEKPLPQPLSLPLLLLPLPSLLGLNACIIIKVHQFETGYCLLLLRPFVWPEWPFSAYWHLYSWSAIRSAKNIGVDNHWVT